jgi:hypothetical protein
MSKGQFQMAAQHELASASQHNYTNAVYADGTPFPAYKQFAGQTFTDYTPSGQTQSNIARQANLPTNNTLLRNMQIDNGVGFQNKQNNAWVYRSQTLMNNGDPIACVNNTDCSSWPGTTCNSQYSNWSDSKGNQGNYCASTKYPELAGGRYNRVNAMHGGIGKACTTDSDCNTSAGYTCNTESTIFGSNIQQTGYCSQSYDCSTGKQFLGYPYNSGIPIVPEPEQNNNGKGYKSKEDCVANAHPLQNCEQDSRGAWFAVYPGLCPTDLNMRKHKTHNGELPSSSQHALGDGIVVPAYASNKSSSITKPVPRLSAWNVNATNSHNGMDGPLQYELAINPQ